MTIRPDDAPEPADVDDPRSGHLPDSIPPGAPTAPLSPAPLSPAPLSPARKQRSGPAVGTLLAGLVGLGVLVLCSLAIAGTSVDAGAAAPLVIVGIGAVVILVGLVGLRRG